MYHYCITVVLKVYAHAAIHDAIQLGANVFSIRLVIEE